MNDSNNTKKIFVQNIVINSLRSQQKIILTIISFDIAATFLDDNQIAHVRFKIFLNFNNQNICDINKNTNRATLIKKTKLIFWNETFMQRKYNMLIVNCIFFNFCDVDKIVFFNNKIVCFCNDFKQCLFIYFNKFENTIIVIYFQHVLFWKNVNFFWLKINMRFRNSRLNAQKQQNATQFVAKMLKIDNAIITHVSSNNNYNWVF